MITIPTLLIIRVLFFIPNSSEKVWVHFTEEGTWGHKCKIKINRNLNNFEERYAITNEETSLPMFRESIYLSSCVIKTV
jgi:hypothetical protein